MLCRNCGVKLVMKKIFSSLKPDTRLRERYGGQAQLRESYGGQALTPGALTPLVCLLALLISLPARGLEVWEEPLEPIFWGDLHVHTGFSLDAFAYGTGIGRYPEEAGLYALYCGKLDFYAITDHAEMMTDTQAWSETLRSVEAMNDLAEANPDAGGDPVIIAFAGFEWTQRSPFNHKNAVFLSDDPARLAKGPIAAGNGIQSPSPVGIYKGLHNPRVAKTPDRLFAMLRSECTEAGTGCQVVVIPHGNAWGQFYTDWKLQLPMNDPELQVAIEVYSKHGNSEEYSYFPPDYRFYHEGKEVSAEFCTGKGLKQASSFWAPKPKEGGELPECEKVCQPATASYLPCCWRAGEIVAERCQEPDSEWCLEQIQLARQEGKPFPKKLGPGELSKVKAKYRWSPGEAKALDWGVCGQCRDCYQPAMNYVNTGSVQAALATAVFDSRETPLYYRFGFVASTDTHSGTPGAVKEDRSNNLELPPVWATWASYPFGGERLWNFFNPGGLAAVLAPRRTREDLFANIKARHTYGTSGARIEVWARAVVESPVESPVANRGHSVLAMGGEAASGASPVFYLKARGALAEDPTCPYEDEPLLREHLSRRRFEQVCSSQCYRPLDQRVPIARIEVIKILQPLTRSEAEMENLEWSPENPAGLIHDPYQVEEFHAEQVDWSWSDPEFSREPLGRTVAYYFRVIQEPTEGYNCHPIALLESGRTCPIDVNAKRIERKVNPQDGPAAKPRSSFGDPCYSDQGEPGSFCQERAWTSPFYIERE